jgi:anti-anti-sigma regulatory factor
MTTNPLCIPLDPDCVVHTLQHEAVESLSAGGEVVLDFSAVLRIDPEMAGALEELADRAAQAAGKVVLRDVNIDVYKVLKLLNLAQRFSFTASGSM